MKRLQYSRTINANKFHHTADKIKTQKANEVETQRIEFKGLKVPITQSDFQNKGKSGWTGTSSVFLKLPLRHLRPSVIYSVPCDRIV